MSPNFQISATFLRKKCEKVAGGRLYKKKSQWALRHRHVSHPLALLFLGDDGTRLCLPEVRLRPPPLAVPAPARNILYAPFRVPFVLYKIKEPVGIKASFMPHNPLALLFLGDDGTRTRHFQIANLTLYQMSYIPVRAFQPSSFALRISNMVVHVQISSGLK